MAKKVRSADTAPFPCPAAAGEAHRGASAAGCWLAHLFQRIISFSITRIKPKEPAVITEINGTVKYGGLVRGQRKIIVESETGDNHEYLLPRWAHVSVQEGEHVQAGDPLMDGPRNPHDILRVLGPAALQRYLVDSKKQFFLKTIQEFGLHHPIF